MNIVITMAIGGWGRINFFMQKVTHRNESVDQISRSFRQLETKDK